MIFQSSVRITMCFVALRNEQRGLVLRRSNRCEAADFGVVEEEDVALQEDRGEAPKSLEGLVPFRQDDFVEAGLECSRDDGPNALVVLVGKGPHPHQAAHGPHPRWTSSSEPPSRIMRAIACAMPIRS